MEKKTKENNKEKEPKKTQKTTKKTESTKSTKVTKTTETTKNNESAKVAETTKNAKTSEKVTNVKEPKKNINVLAILLAIVVIILVGYICFSKMCVNKNDGIVSNKVLKVLNSSYIEHDENRIIFEVQNVSSTDYKNVEPRAIFYDVNGMPVSEDYDTIVKDFKAGATRYFEFDVENKNYSRVEIGLFNTNIYANNENVEGLSKYISYSTEKIDNSDDGIEKVLIKGKNSSKKDAEIAFQIGYYINDKLLSFSYCFVGVKPNAEFEAYANINNSYYNGDAFPEGFTYKVLLAEAIEVKETTEEKEESNNNVTEDVVNQEQENKETENNETENKDQETQEQEKKDIENQEKEVQDTTSNEIENNEAENNEVNDEENDEENN